MPRWPKKEMSLDERIGTNTDKMTVADRESVKAKVAEMEGRLQGDRDQGDDETFQMQPQDPGALRKQIAEKKALLHHDEELNAKGGEKDRLFNRKKELEAELEKNICSKREMWVKDPTDHVRAVQKNYAWQQKHGDQIRELQQINIRLNPDDETAQSIEYLRSEV